MSASSPFELLEFTVPVQADPSNYERLVLTQAGPTDEVIRWHISGPAAEAGMLTCEAVVYRPPSVDAARPPGGASEAPAA